VNRERIQQERSGYDANSLFPDVAPEIKSLNRIEERILAPRIAFIEIRCNYVDSQLKSKGRIV